tara:strand:+ start:198 stop:536 length:339 start_codon:yes stop_codon:yes gene_type:complete
MKKLIMIAVAAMLALNVAAEDNKEAPKKGGRQGLMKELELSKEQTAKMRELNKKFAEKVKGLSQEERKAKMKDIQKERQAAVAEILNEEQQAKLKELMAKRRGAGKGKKKPE